MDNRALRAAKTYVINELRAAEQSELQSLRHLRNAGQEWIKIKEELGGRGLNISDWCKTHMPVSRQWLDRHAELAKGWREFLSARKWAGDVGYTSRRESGLDFALELMAAKNRSDTISSASVLAPDPNTKRLSPVVTALSRVRIITGDALERLRTLPSASVDVCVTSPPYFGSLRNYQCEGQIGNEPTIEAYVDKLVAVFQEVRRVLREEGSLWINVGDLYASATTAWAGQGGIHRRQNKPLMAGTRAKVPVGFKPKDLMLIGAQVAIALQKDGWFLRNEIIWHKKGVRPENVSDRFTRTHEKVYLFSKASNYWFNQDEVREPLVTRPPAMAGSTGQALPRRVLRVGDRVRVWTANPLGRNGRDIWEIATTSHKGKHPATFPTELVRRCLKASCPPGGHVLDPFGGSGTTGLAAVELGHTATLVELNPEYVDEARCRLRAEAASAAAITKSGPMVLNKSTTLYHGDCCELMRAIPDGTVDIVVIDPPFYLNVPTDRTVIDYYIRQNGMKARFRERWDQFDDPNDYLRFSESLLDQARRVLSPSGSVFVFAVHQNLGLIDLVIRSVGLNVLHHVVWAKRNPTPMLSTRRLQFAHETIIWSTKTDGYKFNYRELKMAEFDGDNFKRPGKQHKDIFEAVTSAGKSVGHPAQKPVSVYGRLLAIAGKPGGVLLDPCAGSGTAAIAARLYGMKAILIERDQGYVDLIRRRLQSNTTASRTTASL